jgi:hypothetical protein
MTMVATVLENLKKASKSKTKSDGDRRSVLHREQLVQDQVRGTLRIVDILKIPTEERSAAADEILAAIDQCADKASDGRIGANIKSFERIGLLCKQLLEEFRRLNGSGRRFLGDDSYDDQSFEFFPSAIQKLAARATLIKPARRPAHRPNRSIKNPLVQTLVFELYRVVGKRGGKLTLGMHISAHKANGTLPAVLAVLHHLLPALVSPNIPYQTLRRMRQHALDQLYGSPQSGPLPPEQL